jgi:hypothetical protein
MTSTTLPARIARLCLASLAVAFTVSCGGGGDKNPTEPVAATQLGLVVAPSTTARSGIALAAQPVVRLLDASGNRVLKAGVAVTASIATGGGTLGGTTTVVTDEGGSATFTDLVINGVVGPRMLRFTAVGLATANSATITLAAGDPIQLAFLTPMGTVASGSVIAPPIKVVLQDNGGNQTTATSTVTLTLTSETSRVALAGTQIVDAVDGVATFSDLVIDGSGSDYILYASSGMTMRTASNVFTVDAAPGVATTSPANGATGVTLGQAVTVTFSEPVVAVASAFQLACPAGTPVAVSVSASPATTYTITPSAVLPQATSCRLTVIAANVHDADSFDGPDVMATDYVATFTTMSFHAVDDDWSADAAKRVIGNTSFVSGNGSPSFGVTDNDDIGAGAAVVWTGWNGVAGRTEQGGEVSITATGAQRGRFTYDARAGFEGTDRFSYIIADGNAVDTATVTLAVSGMIWFVDMNAPSCTTIASGCGRLSHPYSSLTAFQAENDAAGDHPGAGDAIFVAQSNAAYAGALTLLAGQKLVGQDATSPLATLTGLVPAAGATSLPAMMPNDAAVTRLAEPVVLAADNTVRGLEIATSSGTALSGAAIGTLHVGADLNVVGAARALDLAGTAIEGSFGRVHASGSGATGPGINLVVQGTVGTVTLGTAADTIAGVTINFGTGSWVVPATLVRGPDDRAVSLGQGVAGAVSFTGNIVKRGTTNIAIQSIAAATVTFSGASKDLSQVLLDGNRVTTLIAFTNGGLHIDGGATLIGLRSRSGGTLTITGPDNTVAASGAGNPAVYISGATVGAAGVTLRSVSASAGQSAGLWLENVSGAGRFEVTGSGASDRSNVTRGRVSTRAPNDPTGTGALVLGSGGTLQGGSPVLLRSGGTVVLRNIISDAASTNGVDATGTTQLILDNALVTNARQYGVYVADRSSALITHSEILGSASAGGDASVAYADPVPGDTVEHSVIRSTTYYGVSARLEARSAEVVLQNLALSQSTWCAAFFGGNQVAGVVTSFRLRNSDLACQNGVVVDLTKWVADGTVEVSGNKFASTASNATEIDFVADTTNAALVVTNNTMRQNASYTSQALSLAGNGSTVRLTISGNVIGNAALPNSGGAYALLAAGKQNYIASFSGNQFAQTSNSSVWFNGSGTLQFTARNESYRVNPAVSGQSALRFEFPAAGAHCADVRSNNVLSGTMNGVRLSTAAGTESVGIAGYTGAANSVSALQTYLGSSAVATTNTPGALVVIGAGSTVSGATSCQLP